MEKYCRLTGGGVVEAGVERYPEPASSVPRVSYERLRGRASRFFSPDFPAFKAIQNAEITPTRILS